MCGDERLHALKASQADPEAWLDLARRRPLAPSGGRCADLKPAAWGNGRCESADPARTMLPTRPKAPRQTALRTRIRTKHAE